MPPAAGPSTSAASARAVRYLLRAQNTDGGFGAAPGQRSGALFTGWAGLGLAAAGRNPRDVHRRGGRSLASYVRRGGGSLADIGEIERTVLLLKAAGLSPRSFAGKDLVAAIRSRRRDDGSVAGYVSYTAFGALALRAAGESAGAGAIGWLVRAQNADGGFGLAPSSASDSDMTGSVLQALAVTGRKRSAAARRAEAWLRANQNDDGGYGQFRGRSSNAQSTAYAVQGLVAVDAGGEVVSRALRYLTGLQRSDGAVAYSSTSAQTPVWVTAQALMALRRAPLPLETVARRERAAPERAAETVAGPPREGAKRYPERAIRKPPRAPAKAPRPPAKAEVKNPVHARDDGPTPGLALDRTRARAPEENKGGTPAGWLAGAGLAALALVAVLGRRKRPLGLRRGRAL